MISNPQPDDPVENVADFFRIQTETGWGATLAQFAEWCDPCPGWRALDVGCGPGLLPALFQQLGCHAFGAELDGSLLSQGVLHPALVIADAFRLPFQDSSFDLVTASNLLFLLEEPLPVLLEMARLIAPQGRICLLNPSEHLSVSAASEFAVQRGLNGLGQASLINWAVRAENNRRWTERQTDALLADAGLTVMKTTLKIGPGFARYTCGVVTARPAA